MSLKKLIINKLMSFYKDEKTDEVRVGRVVSTVIMGLIFLFIILPAIFGSFGTISAGEVGVKTNLGKIVGIVQPGFYLMTNTVEHTTNGDWKGGPYWKPNSTTPTSITWRTGGHRKNKTFVKIDAIYLEEYIKNTIIKELNSARKELNDLGIPTEIPPFL